MSGGRLFWLYGTTFSLIGLLCGVWYINRGSSYDPRYGSVTAEANQWLGIVITVGFAAILILCLWKVANGGRPL